MHADLIAPCGMNCALCANYLAMKYDLKKQGLGMGYCPGCRPRGKNCIYMRKNCELMAKGRVTFCFECADYPCQKLKNLDKRYRTSYHLSMIANLDYIKTHGLDEFLQQQMQQWQCPECGGAISCHGGLCYRCELERLKARGKGRYKWEE